MAINPVVLKFYPLFNPLKNNLPPPKPLILKPLHLEQHEKGKSVQIPTFPKVATPGPKN